VVDSGRWHLGLLGPRELGEGRLVVKPLVDRWALVCWVREREREREGARSRPRDRAGQKAPAGRWELVGQRAPVVGRRSVVGERERERDSELGSAEGPCRSEGASQSLGGRWGRGRWPERVRFGKMGGKIGQ
jgi:hypothetical protein